jgi:hypothetical protein
MDATIVNMQAQANLTEITPLNIYNGTPEGRLRETLPINGYLDFIFKPNKSKNMNELWQFFHKTENYPDYYMGVAEKVAICKCPDSGNEEWFNGKRCLSIMNPMKGWTVRVQVNMRGDIYGKDYIFMGWVKQPVHEWRMKHGDILQLEQKFIDSLLPIDKKYLKMNR